MTDDFLGSIVLAIYSGIFQSSSEIYAILLIYEKI